MLQRLAIEALPSYEGFLGDKASDVRWELRMELECRARLGKGPSHPAVLLGKRCSSIEYRFIEAEDWQRMSKARAEDCPLYPWLVSDYCCLQKPGLEPHYVESNWQPDKGPSDDVGVLEFQHWKAAPSPIVVRNGDPLLTAFAWSSMPSTIFCICAVPEMATARQGELMVVEDIYGQVLVVKALFYYLYAWAAAWNSGNRLAQYPNVLDFGSSPEGAFAFVARVPNADTAEIELETLPARLCELLVVDAIFADHRDMLLPYLKSALEQDAAFLVDAWRYASGSRRYSSTDQASTENLCAFVIAVENGEIDGRQTPGTVVLQHHLCGRDLVKYNF